jgi:beta-galactosidase
MAEEIMSLSATWKIQATQNSSTPPKPNEWKAALSPSKGVNSFWYQQSVNVPTAWEGKRLFLDFHRIEGDAIIFVNDKKVGELLRPGGEIEISSHVKTGSENLIRVFITRDYTDISRGFEQDRIRYVCRTHNRGKLETDKWGVGVSGKVNLISRPQPAGIASAFANTSWRKKEISFDIEIVADSAVGDLTAAVDVLDDKGAKALSFEKKGLSVPAGRSKVKVSSKWENPRLWELDGGYLYTAQVKLLKGNTLLDSALPSKFGFREIWADGRRLMMNGHDMHWRLVMLHSSIFGDSSPKGMAFARLMGYNAGYIQDHPEMWWRGCGWAKETPLFSQDLLDAADSAGFAIMLPAPSVSYLGTAVFEDAAARKDFEREMDLHMRLYRNHPSVMSWIVGMNSIGFSREAISPQNMGQREEKRIASGQAKAVATACEIAKAHDPSRFAYSHADGNIGDIASTCFYLNFAPLQEREEWMQAWSKTANMPYMMAECGQPYTANFWKGKRFLPTEYTAIYLGDAAYAAETEPGLEKLVTYSLDNKNGHGSGGTVNWNDYPAYWDFQRLFVRNTNRAWRISGLDGGWQYWNLDIGYGKPAKSSFESFPLITAKPDWASPNFDIESQANKQLLAYMAGAGSHTDKTHIFFSGETVSKSVAIAWDGPGKTKIENEWSLKSADGSTIASGKLQSDLGTGDIKRLPFSFAAPKVTGRADFTIELKTVQDGKAVEGDSFQITVFPKKDVLKLRSKIAVYDPEGKSIPWLKSIGVNAVQLKKGDKPDGYDILIVGREAIVQCEDLPYTRDDIGRGLKVLVLEQLPAVWRGLGFRSNETMPRRVFPSAANCPVMNGLTLSDLTEWRGSPDLLPEGINQPSETKHVFKWTNTHAIASSIPQIPRAAGFSPLLSAEFDLDYAPLLEWRFGKGIVLFSSLDLSGRVGAEPAATIMAQNIFTYLDSAVPERTRRVVCAGGQDAIGLLRKLGVEPVQTAGLDNPAGTIMVVANAGVAPAQKEIEKFASEGGRVLFLPQSPENLSPYGLKTLKKSIQRVPSEKSPSFRNIGSSLLRWRDSLPVDAFQPDGQPQGTSVLAGGIAAVRPIGKGLMLFCQVSPSILLDKYGKDKDKAEAVDLSVIRLEQLMARLLGNLGAEPSEKIAARVTACLDSGSMFVPLKSWNVIGPYMVHSGDGKTMMDTKFSAEDMAIAGDPNPNITFPNPNGKAFDWRGTVNADKNGLVNLGAYYKLESKAVAYVSTVLNSETERNAMLRVGCDWRMKVWVNGKEVFQTLNGKNMPAAYSVNVPLKKGDNTISFKIGSGDRGFGFYADITKEVKAGKVRDLPELKKVSYYADRPLEDEFDPYFFTFW